MKTNKVRIVYEHLRGGAIVSADMSWITFVRYYVINERVLVPCEWAELSFGPFGHLLLRPPASGYSPELAKEYENFLAELTLDDVMENSFIPGKWILPVSSLEFEESGANSTYWDDRIYRSKRPLAPEHSAAPA